MTDHSQCRLLLGHRGAAFPWDWQPCSHPGPSPPHRTLPHQAPAAELLALPHPREQAQSLPSSPPHLPPPDKANSPFSRSPACCAPPLELTLSGRFVLRVPSALLFLASL